MRYAYPCDMTPDVEEGSGFVVTFPDVRGAVTGAATWDESLFLADDAIIAALGIYIRRGRDIPAPSRLQDGQVLITVPPIQSAKLDLYSTMRERGVSKTELADYAWRGRIRNRGFAGFGLRFDSRRRWTRR